MSITKPVPVPKKEITSRDLVGWRGGLNLNGPANAPDNSWIDGKDVELSIDGFPQPRRTLIPFLPDTVETTYQKYPVAWNGHLYYFVADNNKIRFCQEGDTAWTDCGGSNTITTNAGGKPKFLRVLNNVLLLNGTNGDKLAYADLSTTGFPVVKFLPVTDPTTAPTGALTNLSAGSYNIYYAYSFSSTTGETVLSSILTKSISIVRDQWGVAVATPSSITITRPAGVPTNATYWNLYVANAAQYGTVQDTDMLQLATKLDLSTVSFVDDGTLDINLGSIAPTVNNTDGPRVDHGVIEDGNPILFGDKDNVQNIWIGGGGINAMDFSVNGGGYRAEPEKGTNFTPTAVIGFRNGQGIPSLTVLYSNTEGLSKQAVLEQSVVTYGTTSFSVWGVKEQHYGAAGVAATDSAINYNGKLLFISTDGGMSMNTQPLRQNVIATDPITIKTIDKYIRRVKNSAMNTIVGAGWNGKFMWTMPNDGFDTPQQILVLDDNNKVQDASAWYTMNIPAQWIGVVSPQTDAAFVYISQGKSSYKLVPGNGTFDSKGSVPTPFSTSLTGPMVGMGDHGEHNHWRATVQTMFDMRGIIGDITVGINYKNQNGRLKTKSTVWHGPVYTPGTGGGYGDPGWSYSNLPSYASEPAISVGSGAVTTVDKRIPLRVDDIMNEAEWFYSTPVGYCAYQLRSVSFEGISLGVRPDLQ